MTTTHVESWFPLPSPCGDEELTNVPPSSMAASAFIAMLLIIDCGRTACVHNNTFTLLTLGSIPAARHPPGPASTYANQLSILSSSFPCNTSTTANNENDYPHAHNYRFKVQKSKLRRCLVAPRPRAAAKRVSWSSDVGLGFPTESSETLNPEPKPPTGVHG